MTDDLVFRLKQMEEFFHLDYHRIKKVSREAGERIEQLEAALDDMSQYVSRADWHYLKPETIVALGEKKDG